MKASKLIKSAALLFRGFTFATADEWFYLDGIKKYKRKKKTNAPYPFSLFHEIPPC